MKIKDTKLLLSECNCINCKACLPTSNIKLIEFNPNKDIVLCDKCLQELNRKIVEHLAKENI